MQKILFFIFGILCLQNFAFSQPLSHKKTIIRNVNIISCDPAMPQIMKARDIYIENGIIKKVERTTGKYPKGYEVIDANNKYILPGLTDMHLHLPYSTSVIQPREYYLLLLMNGVTAVRQMRGKHSDLAIRDNIREGDFLGCHTYISTPPFFWFGNDYKESFFNETMCRDSLKKYRSQGFDFVKYVGGLSANQYDTFVAVANSLGFEVTGHAPQNDLKKAVESGEYTIEHIDPYIRLYKDDSLLFWRTIDEMVHKHLYNCPDLVWYIMNGAQTAVDKKRNAYGIEFLDKDYRDTLVSDELAYYTRSSQTSPVSMAKQIDYDSEQVAAYEYLLPRMQQRGLRLLIGECPGEFMVPGFNVATEMELFVKSGISPFETIKCSTYNAAECLNKLDKWGMIATGMHADMVLLSANPLDDIDNIRKVDATIIGGNVLTHDYLLSQWKKLKQRQQSDKALAYKNRKISLNDSVRAYRYWDSADYSPLYSQRRQHYLDSALSLMPWKAWWWQQKSMPLFKQRKYEIGMMYLDSAVKYDKNEWIEYRAFIKCIFQKNYGGALKDFEMARTVHGNSGVMDHSYNFYTGLCYLQLDQFDSAEYFINKSITDRIQTSGEDMVNLTEWFYMGIVYYEKEDYAKADAIFDKALKKYKNFSDAKYYKCRCLVKLKKMDAAYALLQEADNDLKNGHSLVEDNAVYEKYPYQVEPYYITNMLNYLRSELKITKG